MSSYQKKIEDVNKTVLSCVIHIPCIVPKQLMTPVKAIIVDYVMTSNHVCPSVRGYGAKMQNNPAVLLGGHVSVTKRQKRATVWAHASWRMSTKWFVDVP